MDKRYEEALERAKAKAYDEALEWMRDLYPTMEGSVKEDAEHYFPELKESEDERIRKELISFVNKYYGEETKKEVLAYLEKQKEQKPELPLMNGDADLYFDEWRQHYQGSPTKRECFEEGMRYAQRLQKPSTPEDIAAAYQMGLAEGRKEQKPLSTKETELNSIAFLEQMGYTCIPPKEQKPTEMDNEEIELSDFESELFSAFSDAWQQYLHGEEVDMAQWAKEHSAQLLNVAKQELKPAEWSEDFEDNIRNLLHDKLTGHSEDGSMSWAISIDDKTLKDIVSGIWFYVGKEALKYPNKELSQPEWSEEDERTLTEIINSVNGFDAFTGIILQNYEQHERKINWLKSLSPQPKQECSEKEIKVLDSIIGDYEKAAKSFCGYDGKIALLKAIRDGEYDLSKQEWSEEDNFMASAVENSFRLHCGQMTDRLSEQYKKFFEKVKSLRPQPKQEWSEEDEHCIELLDMIIDSSALIPKNKMKCHAFLKFIRPQSHWRPSEYTLSLVKKVADGEMLAGVEQMAMGTLYEQLKKL